MSEVKKKTLLLVMKDGLKKKITIPEEWKATFGPLVPGSKDLGGGGNLALRLWSGGKGKDIQHAVFTEVASFRDMSITIEEEVEESRQETFRKEGGDDQEAIVAEVKVKSWVNPDQPVTSAVKRPNVIPGQLVSQVRNR